MAKEKECQELFLEGKRAPKGPEGYVLE